MPKVTPEIDQENLQTVLEAVASDGELADQLEKGATPVARWFEKTPKMKVRAQEVRHCINWPTQWRKPVDKLNKVIWDCFHDYVHADADLAEVTSRLERACTSDLYDYQVIVRLKGTEPIDPPASLGEAIVGTLPALIEKEGLEWDEKLEEFLKVESIEDFVGVYRRVRAPDPKEATLLAQEDALEAMSILSLQALRGQGSSPWVLETGTRALCWDEQGETDRSWFHDQWLTQAQFSYSHDAAEPTTRPPLAANQAPWKELPEGRVADTLKRSYEMMGAAVRQARQPEASFVLGVSALESAYIPDSPGGGKQEFILARRLLVATAREAGVTHPEKLRRLYDYRNDLLHDGEVHRWSRKDARSQLGDIYRHLDQLAALAVENDCQAWEDVNSVLFEEDIIEDTQKWIAEWANEMSESQKRMVLEELKDNKAPSVWGQVKNAAETRFFEDG